MAVCTFDQLLYTLRVSVEAANEALRGRRAASVDAGDTDAQALHVQVPRDPGPSAPLEPVVIPLRAFRDPRVPQVTELSVAFDCRLRYERGPGGVDELVIDMRPVRRVWFRRRPRMHHMSISFHARDQWVPRIVLDDRVVSVPVAAGAG
jgi:hypothetical protein